MSIIVLFLWLLISLIKADTCSYPCHYCCINGECREQRQCISVIEGFIGIILGAIWWIGSVVIFWWYLRMYDNKKLYKKALDKITKANWSNTTPRSETREDIVNVLNTAKVTDISQVHDLSKEELYGSSYEGRNLITSRFYISVNEVWNNSKILRKMNINNNLKYGKYFIAR